MRDFRRMVRALRYTLGALVVFVLLSASGFAQTQPQDPVEEYVPMSQTAPREVLPATPLVFYAYSFVWLVLLGYVFMMWRRMARVEQDLADVQRRLKDGGGH